MHKTPLLVQAAEAVLRGALEPAMATRTEDYQTAHALQASPLRRMCGMPSLETFL